MARTLRLKARGELVRRLQQRLAELGYDPGPEDGLYGHLTFAAVRELQRHLRLPADGFADRRVLNALADPLLENMHKRLIIAELHESVSAGASARAVQRHVLALSGISLPAKLVPPALKEPPEQAGPPDLRGSEGLADPVSAAKARLTSADPVATAGKEQLTVWHTIHTRGDGGAGHYQSGLLQRLLHRRAGRAELVRQALRLGAANGRTVQLVAGTGGALAPQRLYLDLGSVAWGDGGHVLKVVRRLSRELSRRGGELIVSVPLRIGGGWGDHLLKTLDLGALAAAATYLVLIPPVAVGGSATRVPRRLFGRAERTEPRPPSPAQISTAIRDVVAEVPSWRCLLLIPLGAVMLDCGQEDADNPGRGPTVLAYQQALALAYNNRTRPQWDDEAARPVFRCTHRGRPVAVWLENRYSIEHKLSLVDLRHLGGAYLYALGLEDARIWSLVRERWSAPR